jgi:ribosomal protein S27AE
MKAICPECGEETGFAEGTKEVYCMRCDYKMKITYKVEKIEGDPLSFLLKRAEEDKAERVEFT